MVRYYITILRINKAIERVICNISNVGLTFVFVASFIVAFININDQKLMDSIIEAIKINDSNIANILVSYFLGFYFLLVFSSSTMPLEDKIDKYYVNRRSDVEWNLLVKSKLIKSNLIQFINIENGINSLLLFKLLFLELIFSNNPASSNAIVMGGIMHPSIMSFFNLS